MSTEEHKSETNIDIVPKDEKLKPEERSLSEGMRNLIFTFSRVNTFLWTIALISLIFVAGVGIFSVCSVSFSAVSPAMIGIMFSLVFFVFVGALAIPYTKIKNYLEELIILNEASELKYIWTYKFYAAISLMVLLLVTFISVMLSMLSDSSLDVNIPVSSLFLSFFFLSAISIFIINLINAFSKFVNITSKRINETSQFNVVRLLIFGALTCFILFGYFYACFGNSEPISIHPLILLGLALLLVMSIFMSDLTVRGFISYLRVHETEIKKGSRRISMLWYMVIILLIGLVSVSIVSVVNKESSGFLDPMSISSFLVTGFGLFIAGSIFFPQFTMERLVNDKIDSVRRVVSVEISDQLDENKRTMANIQRELLLLEAHECRMNTYFLFHNKKFGWSVGWALKAVYKYQVLLCNDPMDDRSDVLIEDLIDLTNVIFKEIRHDMDLPDGEKVIQDKYYCKHTEPIDDIPKGHRVGDEFRINIRQYDIRTRYVRYFKVILKYVELELIDRNIKYGRFREDFKKEKSFFHKFVTNEDMTYVFRKFALESSMSDREQIFRDFNVYPKCLPTLKDYFQENANFTMEKFINGLVKEAEFTYLERLHSGKGVSFNLTNYIE